MEYKYIDTFIKTCSSKNDKGVCKKTRESVKCIDNKCEKIQGDKHTKKKDILQEYYKDSETFNKLFPNVDISKSPLVDTDTIKFNYSKIKEHGQSIFDEMFPEHSLSKPKQNQGKGYQCPVCKENINIRSSKDHLNKHIVDQKLASVMYKTN